MNPTQYLEITQYRDYIVRPICDENSVGERLIDDPQFDFIDDQMMKVGSLSHADVQWQNVEQHAIALLGEKSKDIKLLVHLLQCLHHELTPQRLILSFEIMSDFMTHYWTLSFPVPGARGTLPRRKFFHQICQRFTQVMEKWDVSEMSIQMREELNVAAETWHRAIEAQDLPLDDADLMLANLRAQLRQQAERDQYNAPPLATGQDNLAPLNTSSVLNTQEQAEHIGVRKREDVENPSSTSIHSTPTHSTDAARSTDAMDSDTSAIASHVDRGRINRERIDGNRDDPELKKSLLSVAKKLAQQDSGSALAIRLRRHILWGTIRTLPDHDAQGKTPLRGMVGDRLKEYQEGMHQPDLILWQQIEQSLTIAPYWFEGQWMSHQIADSLGRADWCQAILEETRAFITRFPQLETLTFKDGSPFVNAEVRAWLASKKPASNPATCQIENWLESSVKVRESIFTLAKEKGIAAALAQLNEGLLSATEPRDRFYWRLMNADLLKHHQWDAMATEQYQTLYQELLTASVTDWEPSLIEQLQQQIASE